MLITRANAIYSLGHGLHTLTAVPMLAQEGTMYYVGSAFARGRGHLPAHYEVYGISSLSQSYSVGGSSDVAIRCQYRSKLLLHTNPFSGPFSGTTQVSRYQQGKTNLDFTEARDSEWQWHQLGHMQVCISLQTDNHASTPLLSFLQSGCPSCHPTNSIKALKA